LAGVLEQAQRRGDKMQLIKTKEEAKTSLVRCVSLPLSPILCLDGEIVQGMRHPLNLNLDLSELAVLIEKNPDIDKQEEYGILLTKEEAKTANEDLLLWVSRCEGNAKRGAELGKRKKRHPAQPALTMKRHGPYLGQR
jgi:hypothetical protein